MEVLLTKCQHCSVFLIFTFIWYFYFYFYFYFHTEDQFLSLLSERAGLSGLRRLKGPQHEDIEIASLQSLNLLFFFFSILNLWLLETESELKCKNEAAWLLILQKSLNGSRSPKRFEVRLLNHFS